ncbi:MAG: hypothetical protein HOP29_19940, partial [Phycisphaerales bacterium]|nr:hypothetical protein [Phycisphaerales bacterium]
RRVAADWGEGASDAPLREGNGAAAAVNDATWRHRFFSGVFWSTMGGQYSGTTSGSAVVGGIGSYTWGSTSQMVADVQGWLDSPATNFGWIMIGGEAATATVKRFSSREAIDPAERPTLTIRLTTCECVVADECDDDTVCTFDACGGGFCGNTPMPYGDVNGDGAVDIFDILCVLDGFAGNFDTCALVNLDLTPCPAGDGVIDIFDILAVLDGFAGEQGCCGP